MSGSAATAAHTAAAVGSVGCASSVAARALTSRAEKLRVRRTLRCVMERHGPASGGGATFKGYTYNRNARHCGL
eukprot:2509317-Rhodomonas_salina.3